MKIIRANNPEESQKLAANEVSDYIKNNLQKELLFLVACGSSLEILKYVDINLLSSNITIAVLDERFTKDPTVNNFCQLQKTSFYECALKANCRFIPSIPFDNETHVELAERVNAEVIKWLKRNPNGSIFSTIGVGEDGHIAGLMPFSNVLDLSNIPDGNKYVIPINAEGKNIYALRITPIANFLVKYLDKSIVYVVGENKKDAFMRIIDSNETILSTPAKLIREMRRVSVFTDIQGNIPEEIV